MAEPTYTVFIRVPIPRGDFVDPPSVNWDTTKDEALWNIVSGAAQTEIDWNELASCFDATVDFLLQQVAYLTDRHASQVRAQVRKATAAAKGAGGAAAAAAGCSAAPSPVPSGSGGGGELAGLGVHNRNVSALSLRRDSPMPLPRYDGVGGGGAATPVPISMRSNISRNASGTTLTSLHTHHGHALGGGLSSRPSKPALRPIDTQAGRRDRFPSLPMNATPEDGHPPSPRHAHYPEEGSSPDRVGNIDDDDDDGDDGDSDSSSPAQSRISQRPRRTSFPDDEDDDDAPAFLPPAVLTQQKRQISAQDLTATLKGDPRELARLESSSTHRSQTSDSSSMSSLSMVSRDTRGVGGKDQVRPSGKQPQKQQQLQHQQHQHQQQQQHQNQQQQQQQQHQYQHQHQQQRLSSPKRPTSGRPGLSPGRVSGAAAAGGKGLSREGSEGTPSMGSSFSDLDDASLTHSALVDAYSKMPDGGVGSSRFSILRSRYNPGGS